MELGRLMQVLGGRVSEDITFTYEEASAFYGGLGAAVRRCVLGETLSREEVLGAVGNEMVSIAGQREVRTSLGAAQAEG